MTTPEIPLAVPAGDDGSSPAVSRIQSRVDAAAFALLREGKNPTVALVRDRMGGGSPNLVAPALQKWRFALAGQLNANAGSALEVLPPGVLELVQALWSRALFEAHRVQADTTTSTADAVEQLRAAINALQTQAARLQQREAAVDRQLGELDERLRRVAAQETALAPRTAATRASRRGRTHTRKAHHKAASPTPRKAQKAGASRPRSKRVTPKTRRR
jgi:Plasmid replication region DNA-binding N-term